MSQIQGANSPQYMSWLLAMPSQQTGATTDATSTQGTTDPSSTSFDPISALMAATSQTPDASATQPFSLDAMNTLINAQEQSNGLSPDQQKVFSELDTNNDGTITKSELETDFGADNKQLADAVANKLDTNGDGSISQDEFAAGTKKTMQHGHHHHMHAAPSSDPTSSDQTSPGSAVDALFGNTPGSSTQSLSNNDGSTTTTITYADGSKVSTTSAPTPATDSGNDTSTSSNTSQGSTKNLLEQLIQLQSQLTTSSLATASTTSLSI